MIQDLRRNLRLWICRHLNRHSDIFWSVGHNVGKECRYCFRTGQLTPEEITEHFAGGEDEVAMDAPPK